MRLNFRQLPKLYPEVTTWGTVVGIWQLVIGHSSKDGGYTLSYENQLDANPRVVWLIPHDKKVKTFAEAVAEAEKFLLSI